MCDRKGLTRKLRTASLWLLKAIPTIAQISIVLAALTFFQQQEPSIEIGINHETKMLSLRNAGLTPVNLRAYALEFGINQIVGADHHLSINKDDPIKSLYTRGAIIQSTTIWPFATLTQDLTKSTQLQFDEWKGQNPDLATYCIAFESKTLLGSKSITQILLTPKLKFSASLFGPLPNNSGFGGGYPKTLLAVEKQIREDCLTIFEKTR
jgi:hypothetical protein